MSSLSIMIKPVSESCNLNCSYCFYKSDSKLRSVENRGFMTEETLKIIIEKAFEHAKDSISIVFQGGEPTLRGLDFFEYTAEIINANRKYVKNISVSIQTNGTLLNKNWCSFFKKENWLVGLSLDGTRSVHDKFRRDNNNNGSLEKVLATAKLLQQFSVEFNVLTVVTNETSAKVAPIYNFFKKNNLMRQQYIPCLSEFNKENRFLSPATYGDFLCRLFDLWYKDRLAGVPVYIRQFENYVGMLKGNSPNECGMLGQCTTQYMVEADGAVYPCDFYGLDEFNLGNILTDDFIALENSKKRAEFINNSLLKTKECKACQYYFICRGGCRRNREYLLGQLSKNEFCLSYKRFFSYALDSLKHMAGIF
ncbi:MAG: anaerobic sulfatase maturase [Eubacteriales bacterium]|nr:anaerobic sulfatase maturase [Eubacteriales bacterium]